MPTHAEQRVLPYTPGAAVRPGRRRRALSRVPALVQGARITRARRRRRLSPTSSSASRCSASASPRRVTLRSAAPRSTSSTSTARSATSTTTGIFEPTADGGCLHRFLRRFRVPVADAAEADRPAVQRGRAPHGRSVRDPRAGALRRRYGSRSGRSIQPVNPGSAGIRSPGSASASASLTVASRTADRSPGKTHRRAGRRRRAG